MSKLTFIPALALACGGCHSTMTAPECCSPDCCALPPSTVECRADGACLTTLATGPFSPGAIAVDATSVYWVQGGEDVTSSGVMKVAVSGGDVTALASGASPDGWAIAVDAHNVYWNTPGPNGNVLECAIAGCNNSPRLLATGPSDPNAGPFMMATDGADLYWTTLGSDAVLKCSTAGCGGTPTTFATAQDETLAIAVDSAYVYWSVDSKSSTNGALWRCAKGGCGNMPTVVVSGLASIDHIAVDATNIYWNEYGDTAEPYAARVQTCAKAGCTNPTSIAYGLGPGPIVVDEENVYWTERGNDFVTVNKCAKTGCPFPDGPIEVARLPFGAGGWLAVDATSLYYTTDHAIMKLMPK